MVEFVLDVVKLVVFADLSSFSALVKVLNEETSGSLTAFRQIQVELLKFLALNGFSSFSC